MELKVLEQKENPLFNRIDLKVEVLHLNQATPSKQALVEAIAAHFGVEKEKVKVDYIMTGKGVASSFARVKIVR